MLLSANGGPSAVRDVGRQPAVDVRPVAGRVATAGDPSELRGAALIDSVVARVNRRPITHSQLEAEARLAFARHGELPQAQGKLSDSELRNALEYLIDQVLLEDEAARLEVFEATDAEAKADVEKLVARFSSPAAYQAFLDRFAISSDLVEGAARRGLRAERYLDDKIRVQVQGGIEASQAQRLARELIGQLRSRADVRVLADFETGAPLPSEPGRAPPPTQAPAAEAKPSSPGRSAGLRHAESRPSEAER